MTKDEERALIATGEYTYTSKSSNYGGPIVRMREPKSEVAEDVAAYRATEDPEA